MLILWHQLEQNLQQQDMVKVPTCVSYHPTGASVFDREREGERGREREREGEREGERERERERRERESVFKTAAKSRSNCRPGDRMVRYTHWYLDHVLLLKILLKLMPQNQQSGSRCTSGKGTALKRGIMQSCTVNIKAPN